MIFDAVLYITLELVVVYGPFLLGKSLLMLTFWHFSNNLPNSASVAYVVTLIMIIHITSMGPFSGGISVIGVLFLDFGMRKNLDDFLCASGSEK